MITIQYWGLYSLCCLRSPGLTHYLLQVCGPWGSGGCGVSEHQLKVCPLTTNLSRLLPPPIKGEVSIQEDWRKELQCVFSNIQCPSTSATEQNLGSVDCVGATGTSPPATGTLHQEMVGTSGNSITHGHHATAWDTKRAQSSPGRSVAKGSENERLALWLSKSLNQYLLFVFCFYFIY